ncbi:2'-5' RNA ligase family protein [Mucilaginibacter terrenus]|uniref:2'-5' RNA ligase family protein n=1 Tax=Mucilaginibacter terrenus TaxID=2482727 RepID=A0A3E2NV39_9SPHI|nr:2'-5' RNA ligase family protein [Mucilaginibacter terrenus]RFZ84839.1 2'-5' RNA ligase family protein [Mucilaginibacter terrenus]
MLHEHITQLYNYLYVLSPDEQVKEFIKKYKSWSADVIGSFESRHSIAHITVNYLDRKMLSFVEPSFLNLEYRLRKLPSINLKINGFDCFKESNTIYASIEMDEMTKAWFDQMQTIAPGKPKHKTPHITILKNLSKKNFDLLWPKFQNALFQHTFKIDNLTVLRKEAFNEDARYKTVAEFKFSKRVLTADNFRNVYVPMKKTQPGLQLSAF